MLLLHRKHLISRFLCEKSHCNLLIFHCKISCFAKTCSVQGISYTSRTVFFFLYRSNKLPTCFDINLSCFYDFLKNFCVLFSQYFNLTLLIKLGTSLSQLSNDIVVVCLGIFLNVPARVYLLYFLKMKFVIRHVSQSFQFLKNLTSLHRNECF